MNAFHSMLSKAAKALSNSGEDSEEGGENATEKAAEAISQRVFSHELTGDEKKWAGPAVHYSFGTLLGAVYGMLADTSPRIRAGYGTVYGSMVWLTADEIAVPAFGLSESPVKTPASSHVEALASHLVYGFTTHVLQRAMMKL